MNEVWRQGRRVPRNVYRGDDPIAMVATAEIAAEIVYGMNSWNETLRHKGFIGSRLTSADPEPEPGTVVITEDSGAWHRVDGEDRSWMLLGYDDDFESWARVAGGYGPVTVFAVLPTGSTP